MRSRRPVSMSVRTSAARSSNGHAARTPMIGADQRYSEYQAMAAHAGISATAPEGFTMLRSAILAQSSVSERTGSVMSHSRSHSDLASSPDPMLISNDASQRTNSRNEMPRVSAVLNSTVTQKVPGGSSAP